MRRKSEEKSRMKKGVKQVKNGIVLLLSAALLLSGCGKAVETGSEPTGQESEMESEETRVSSDGANAGKEDVDDLALLLKAKYDAGTIDYSGDTIQIGRDESVEFKISYNPWDETAIPPEESFIVYQDAELQYPLSVSYDWDSETGMMTIEPPVYGPGEVIQFNMDHPSYSFIEESDETGWGNLAQLYMAAYVDVETGEPITGNPLVTVLKIKEELSQAPQVKFSQDENGSARFSWKEVPGAEEYFLFQIRSYEGVWDGYLYVMDSTTDTEWTVEQGMLSEDEDYVVNMNDIFRSYVFDDLDTGIEEYFGVIAVNDEGNSHISNLFNAVELSHMLPYGVYYDAEVEISCEGTMSLPATVGIKMCDDTVSQRVVEYDRNSIEKSGTGYHIDYKIYGTAFTGTYLVNDQDWDTFEQEMEAIEERQEKLMKKGGNVEADISFLDGEGTEVDSDSDTQLTEEETESTEEAAEEVTTETVKEDVTEPDGMSRVETEEDIEEEAAEDIAPPEKSIDYEEGKVTANSALSEYLAIHMLNGSEQIDISAFPEAADTALVVDAFLEAQYQNPLILGIKEVGMDTLDHILYIRYDDDTETSEAKRKELEEKVAEITSEIITDGMSDLDKELAINAYLCDNAVYDNDALENAEENDFKYVDERYNDSFTAYGVLVNNVGVCASYSAAFKLLADAADLESVVVTGYLEGNLPHAWNKVKLDGKWNIVDATNNDNDVVQNALFNLSDSAAYSMLVEDERFVLDSNLYDYEAPSDDNEYYRITDNYYSVDEITDALVEKLQTEGSALLRTDYALDDETFSMIAQEAANAAHANISGLHWMGVIRLEQQ